MSGCTNNFEAVAENLERWSTAAFGSPGYTHLHAAGIDPGDISIHLFDTCISFDDKVFWNRGKFIFLDRPDARSLLDNHQTAVLDSSTIMSTGM